MRQLIAPVLAAITLLAGPAFAADQAAPQQHEQRPPREFRQPTAEQKAEFEKRRAEWAAMSPEQRQAKMNEMRARREAAMTPEQRAEHEKRRAEWEAMTPEQREAKMKERRHHEGRQRQ